MRIVHVSDCYAPRTGGIETQVAALAGQQARAGDDVHVVTATPGHEVAQGADVVDGLPVTRLSVRLPFELPVHPRAVRAVGQSLDELAPDVVHVHAGVVSPFAWGAIRAATSRSIPTLVTVHSVWGLLAAPGFALSDTVLRWTRWGAQLSAVSTVAALRISDAVPGAGDIRVTPNGIDPAAWRIDPVGADPGRLRVVTVMRMAPRKRTMPLVRIVSAARNALPPHVRLTATLVGDGPQRPAAERLVASRGLAEAIRFTGRLDREGVRSQLARADVFLQPSIHESFGIAALEARTAGLAVVARTQAGTGEFVRDEIEGLLASDDAGLARALVRLGRDRALLDRMTAHNRAVEPASSWPHVLTTVADAYAAARAQAVRAR